MRNRTFNELFVLREAGVIPSINEAEWIAIAKAWLSADDA